MVVVGVGQGRGRFMRLNCWASVRTVVLSILSLFAVVGCDPYESQPTAVSQAVREKDFNVPNSAVGGVDLRAPPALRDSAQPATRPASEIFLGSDGLAENRPVAQADQFGDEVQINFDGAELSEVARVILAEVLGYTYTIDPGVSGSVVLSSSRPLNEDDLLAILETILEGQGAALIERDGGFAIVPIDSAYGQARVTPLGNGEPIRAGPGTGITIVPLRFISATAAAQFIQPLVAFPERIRIDDARNLLLFVGTGPERQNVLETLADIDVNWMKGRSVGIFPLSMSTPEALISELQALFAPVTSPDLGPDTIKFLPMARLNAILAIADQPEQIIEVERWVERLDRGNTVGIQFYVYQLEHAPADEIAKIMTESFGDVPEITDFDAAQQVFGASDGLSAVDGELSDSFVSDSFATSEATSFSANSALLSSIKIVPNEINNSLLIRATPQAYEMIEATLRRLDTAPLQVLIEATIAEVTLNDALRYGVQYFIKSGSIRFGFNNSTSTPSGTTTGNNLNPLAFIPGFNFIFSGGDSNITIDALSELTTVQVLSSPSLVVQDNSEATLSVGDEVPIVTRQQQATDSASAPIVNNIEYRDTGVILEVKPRISLNDIVALEISQEVSRVETDNQLTADDLTPVISQRKITSRVNVLSGQTVVLGGLIQDLDSRNRERVPLLGDIPVLGSIFGSTDNAAVRTELIVFLTPRIIKNAEDARDISEELRSRLRAVRPFETSPNSPPVEPEPVEAPQTGSPPKPVSKLVPEPVDDGRPTALALYGLSRAPTGRRRQSAVI